jgi:hypothetical protein
VIHTLSADAAVSSQQRLGAWWKRDGARRERQHLRAFDHLAPTISMQKQAERVGTAATLDHDARLAAPSPSNTKPRISLPLAGLVPLLPGKKKPARRPVVTYRTEAVDSRATWR